MDWSLGTKKGFILPFLARRVRTMPAVLTQRGVGEGQPWRYPSWLAVRMYIIITAGRNTKPGSFLTASQWRIAGNSFPWNCPLRSFPTSVLLSELANLGH